MHNRCDRLLEAHYAAVRSIETHAAGLCNGNGQSIKETIKDRLDILDTATHLFGSQTEPAGPHEVRVLGNGGLVVNTKKHQWYCHTQGTGGDLFDLISYHRFGTPLNGDTERFKTVLGIAADLAGIALPEHVPRQTNGHGRSPPAQPTSATQRTDCSDDSGAPPNDSGSLRIVSESSRIVHPDAPNDSESCSNHRGRGFLLMTRDIDCLPAPSWLVRHVLPADDLVTVYGASGVGKSFFLLDLSLCIAQHRPVVYVVAEAVRSYRARVHAWCHHYQTDPGHHALWTEAVNLMNPLEVAYFIASVRAHNPALIIFDTLAQCMIGADENSTKDMGLAVGACTRIRQETGATVLLSHHTGKHGGLERGNSALRGACSTMIELTNDGDGLITVKSDKSRDDKVFEPRYFRLMEQETQVLDADTGEPIVSAVLMPTSRMTRRYDTALKQREFDVLDVLAMPYFGGEAGNKDIAEHLKRNPARITEAVNKLLAQGYVSRNRDGRTVTITLTEKGRTLLAERIAQESPHAETPGNCSDQSRIVLNWSVTIPRNDSETIRNCSGHSDAQNAERFGRFGNDSEPSESFDDDSFGFPPLKGGIPNESNESSDPRSDANETPATCAAPVPTDAEGFTAPSVEDAAEEAAIQDTPPQAAVLPASAHEQPAQRPVARPGTIQERVDAGKVTHRALCLVAERKYTEALQQAETAPRVLRDGVIDRVNHLITLMDDQDHPSGWEWFGTPYRLRRVRDGVTTRIDVDHSRVATEALVRELRDAEEAGRFDVRPP